MLKKQPGMKLNEKYRYVVVEGNIGSGKTSLASMIAAETGATLLLEEFAENTFLPQFYKEPSKYAFPLELSFLAARFRQLKNELFRNESQLIVSDYHIRKSLLFAEHNLDEAELELYRSFYDIISSQIPEPGVVIYLNKSISKLHENIGKRGRDFEKNISEKYLSGIQIAYENLLQNHPFSKVIVIDSENLDFVNNEKDYQFIINHLNH